LHSIQQEMTQEFVGRINREIITADRQGRSGTVIMLPDGLKLATVTFHVERWSKRRYIVHAYTYPGMSLSDPQGRFSCRSTDKFSEVWTCTVDPADNADASYVASVLEQLYDKKQASIQAI